MVIVLPSLPQGPLLEREKKKKISLGHIAMILDFFNFVVQISYLEKFQKYFRKIKMVYNNIGINQEKKSYI